MGLWGFFKDPFTKELEPKESLTAYPLEKKKISLTSKEHQDNQDLTVEMIRPSNPKVFLLKACWMMYVFKTVRTSSQIPRSFWTRVSDVPKNGLQQVFLKDYVDLYKMRVWNSLEVFQTQVILTKPWFRTILWGFSNPNLLMFGWFLPPHPWNHCWNDFAIHRQKNKQTPRLATRLPCHKPLPRSAAAGPDASLEDAGRCSWNCWYCCSDLCSFVMILGWFVVLYDERNPARGG